MREAPRALPGLPHDRVNAEPSLVVFVHGDHGEVVHRPAKEAPWQKDVILRRAKREVDALERRGGVGAYGSAGEEDTDRKSARTTDPSGDRRSVFHCSRTPP